MGKHACVCMWGGGLDYHEHECLYANARIEIKNRSIGAMTFVNQCNAKLLDLWRCYLMFVNTEVCTKVSFLVVVTRSS